MSRNSTQQVCSNGLAAAVLLCAAAFQCPAAEKQLVLLYNAAQLPPEVMTQAQDQATRILREAGIELRWIDCSTPLERSPGMANCGAHFSEHPLILQVAGSAGRFPDQRALGYAALGPDGGSSGFVYFDRVEQFVASKKPPCSVSQLLGHAIAHEMGHLLLSLAGHNPKGIMIGGWSLRELEQAADGALLFTPYEAGKMRKEVKRRAAAAERGRRLADTLASR